MIYVVLDSAINFYLCFKVTLCQFKLSMAATGVSAGCVRRNHPKEIDERKNNFKLSPVCVFCVYLDS